MDKHEAGQAVAKLIADLTDRRGFRHVWDDMDDETRNDLRNRWIKILLDETDPPIELVEACPVKIFGKYNCQKPAGHEGKHEL